MPEPPPGPASEEAAAGGRRVWLKRVVSTLLAAAALAFVVHVVPFRDRCTEAGCVEGLFTTLRRANVPLVLALGVVQIAAVVVWSARWRALLGVAGVRLPLLDVFRVNVEAQTGGILLPGGLGGDALRVAYVRDHAPGASLAKILASILADRIVGLVTLSVLALAFGLGARDARLGAAIPVLACVPFGAYAGWWVVRHPAVARSRLFTNRLASRFLVPIHEYASSAEGPAALRSGLLLSLVVSAAQLMIIRGLVLALGGTPEHEGWVFVGTTFSMIVGALPALPGGWGTADAALVFFFARAGLPPQNAVAVLLVYRFFWYTIALMGAGSALARRPK